MARGKRRKKNEFIKKESCYCSGGLCLVRGVCFVSLAALNFFVVGSALKSVDALSFKNKASYFVVAAGVLFLTSDFTLQFSVHEERKLSWAGDQIMNNFSNVTYYAAQFFFAHSFGKDFFEKKA